MTQCLGFSNIVQAFQALSAPMKETDVVYKLGISASMDKREEDGEVVKLLRASKVFMLLQGGKCVL
jgi:hypothetical protein